MSSGTDPLGAAGQAGTPTGDDPAATLARVHALRQVADLGGFPHDPDWDRLEAEAWERLGGRPAAGDPIATPAAPATSAPAPPVDVDDPFLAIAQVRAARQVADELGVAPNPEWEATEEAARRQLSGSADRTPDRPA